MSASGSEDAVRFASALNAGILLLLGAPYLVLGGLGLIFYRAVRKARRQQQEAALSESNDTDPVANR